MGGSSKALRLGGGGGIQAEPGDARGAQGDARSAQQEVRPLLHGFDSPPGVRRERLSAQEGRPARSC